MRIDNSALTLFQRCPSAYYLRHAKGMTRRNQGAAPGFGQIIHEGLRDWYRGKSLAECEATIEASFALAQLPVEDWRDLGKAIETMRSYARTWGPPDQEAFRIVGAPHAPCVEVNFCLPTGLYLPCGLGWGDPIPNELTAQTGIAPRYRHHCLNHKKKDIHVFWEEADEAECCDCGQPKEPLEYGGVFDGLINPLGRLTVFEHKTTSVLGDGDYYFSQYETSGQITGYVWAARLLSGADVRHALINAIGLYKTKPAVCKRHPTFRNEWQLSVWLRDLWHECVEIRKCELSGHWPRRNGACSQYGSAPRCEFFDIHTSTAPEDEIRMLETDFIHQPWDFETKETVRQLRVLA